MGKVEVPLILCVCLTIVLAAFVAGEQWKHFDSTPQPPKESRWERTLYGMTIECTSGIQGGAVFYAGNHVYVLRSGRGLQSHDAGEFSDIHKAKEYLVANVDCENDR